MAEGEAPLLVLAAQAGNNGSIRLLWRGCQASKHFLFILAVGTARGMRDPLCSPAPRRAGRTVLVPRGAGQTAPSRNQSLVQWPWPQILVLWHRGQVRAGQSTAGGEGEGHLGAKTRIPDPEGGIKLLEGLGCSPRAHAPGSSSPKNPPGTASFEMV